MSKFLVFCLLINLLAAACTAEPATKRLAKQTNQEEQEVVKTQGDDLVKTTVKSKTPLREQQENLAKITAKFGEQWDFCSCVVANDSINQAARKEMTEVQYERFMKRWDEIELRCKAFLTVPNTTPEERELHEAKVNRCLDRLR